MLGRLARFVLLIAASAAAVHAAEEDFYKDKVVRIIVGVSPGGGYDTYARTIARHIGKHIPGNPTIIVENRPGAGSLRSANHLYRNTKPDGLTIGHFIGGLFLQQLLGKPGVLFDARKFEFIGVPVQDDTYLGIHRDTGITNLEEWMAAKTPVKFGGIAPGVASDDLPKVLKETLGLPLELISGYPGTARVRLAFRSGEIQGATLAWQSFKSTWRTELDEGLITIVLGATHEPHPELPNVPVALDLVENDEDRQLLRAVILVNRSIIRPFVLPPGTPKERVAVLREAFMATLRDPEFLADAAKARLELNPLGGEEVAQNVAEVFELRPQLVEKLKTILR